MKLAEQYLKMSKSSKILEKLPKQKIADFVEFIKKQIDVDISPYIDLDHSKRDYVNLGTHSMSEKDKRSLFGLEKSYGGNYFKIGDNGGFGHVFHLIGDFSKSNQNEAMHMKDDILEGFTMEELVHTINANESENSEKIVMKVFNDLLEAKIEDAKAVVKREMKDIIKKLT